MPRQAKFDDQQVVDGGDLEVRHHDDAASQRQATPKTSRLRTLRGPIWK